MLSLSVSLIFSFSLTFVSAKHGIVQRYHTTNYLHISTIFALTQKIQYHASHVMAVPHAITDVIIPNAISHHILRFDLSHTPPPSPPTYCYPHKYKIHLVQKISPQTLSFLRVQLYRRPFGVSHESIAARNLDGFSSLPEVTRSRDRSSLLVTILPFTPVPDNSLGILVLPVYCRPRTTFGGHNAFTTPSHGGGKTTSSLRASCIVTTCTESRFPGQKGARGPQCFLLQVLFRCSQHARDTNCRTDSRQRRITSRHFAQNSDL